MFDAANQSTLESIKIILHLDDMSDSDYPIAGCVVRIHKWPETISENCDKQSVPIKHRVKVECCTVL